jgi:hypothetical protein
LQFRGTIRAVQVDATELDKVCEVVISERGDLNWHSWSGVGVVQPEGKWRSREESYKYLVYLVVFGLR